ncbi:GNAT family N-acetyltransferase [Mycolicibacterium sp. XJ652]
MDSLTATGRFRDASRLYEADGDALAVLPLVRPRFAGPLSTAHSMPVGWGYGGLVGPQNTLTATLVSAVLQDLSKSDLWRVHLRPNPLQAPIWASIANRRGVTAVPSRAHVLDLDGGFDTVWQTRFKSAVRREVRRAEEAAVHVETDSSGALVPVFYGLLLKSFDRWATRQHEPKLLAQARGRRRDSLQKFSTIAQRMGKRCQISVAWFEGQPVAAVLVLRSGAVAHYTRGAMDTDVAVPVKVNSLLHKEAIAAACRDGCRRYHMGDSGFSAGLAQFKTRFGAQQFDFAEYWIERLPVHRAGRLTRTAVKTVIGFRDA